MRHEIVDVTPEERRHVLMVVANPGGSTTLGSPVGFWATELMHASYGDAAVGQRIMPSGIEDEAEARGANFIPGDLSRAFAMRDQNLAVGRQQYSGSKLAELVVDALGI